MTTTEITNTREIDYNLLGDIGKQIEKGIVIDNKNDSSDSFFRNILDRLFEDKNTSTKTEYRNVKENFAGAKLEYMGVYCNMPFLKKFVNIFEQKRISLERKGRQEIIMALAEKRKEEEAERNNSLKTMLGIS